MVNILSWGDWLEKYNPGCYNYLITNKVIFEYNISLSNRCIDSCVQESRRHIL